MATLRLSHRVQGAEHVVEVALEGAGAQRKSVARFRFGLTAQDREDMRWYLEDFLQYPAAPAPQIADRVEDRLAALGAELFTGVFEANRDTRRLWDAVAGSLADTRVEVAAGVEGAAAMPWELLRDPVTDAVLALQAGAFVRTHTKPVRPPRLAAETAGVLRVLLVICRPGGAVDVPFRSVASHLMRLSRGAREAFRLDVLRPPTFAQLNRVLEAAKAADEPYHVVHFDGHGIYLDTERLVVMGGREGYFRGDISLVSPPRPGAHGFLVFEELGLGGSQVLVDGPTLGRLLVDAGVPVLVLNACRSAHADPAAEPETLTEELDAHERVRAYGSLAQEVMDSGVAAVVAMRYNVYVVTAARFIGEVYAGLLAGRELGAAVSAARRHLAADPRRQVSAELRSLQDWLVPVVYEAAPLVLWAVATASPKVIDLSQSEAGQERGHLDPTLPPEPGAGFFGRDDTLLSLDRAFDAASVVLLQAWAGAGKTSTALEFARWYALTGAADEVLFTSFTHYLPLARLLDQVGGRFGAALAVAGVPWAALDEADQRDWVLQMLAQVPTLWVWDNVEPVAGFPAGTSSAWTAAEQDELAGFLRELARHTRCKVLLTSRRDEHEWLGNLPRRIHLPPMPMLECLEFAQAIVARQTGAHFLKVQDWRPLLEFSQGNPLTVMVLVRQALREHRTSREKIEAFVAGLRAGAVHVADDATQGRDASLAVALDYGFSQAFTSAERSVLALLALFQGFAEVNALCLMGAGDDPVPTVAGLEWSAGVGLLGRAAEVGLLTAYGGGLYGVHAAVPFHLRGLFERHYGPHGSGRAMAAVRAWTIAISDLGDYWMSRYAAGHPDVSDVMAREEANWLHARQLARQHGWWDLVTGCMQGLRALYELTGRAVEWRRLVAELVPDVVDSATGGPLPGREDEWAMVTSYRVAIARRARDWPAAEQLQNATLAWSREEAATALAVAPDMLDDRQRLSIDNLAVAIEQLGHLQREQGKPGCVQLYLEAIGLCQRISSRRHEATIAFNLGHAYSDLPALRDLDQAERWYQRYLELLEDHDTLGRARATGELGSLAYDRFVEAFKAGTADEERLADYFADAIVAYHQALALLPPDAAADLAVVHNQLGNIYFGDVGLALEHYQQAIEHFERQDDHYEAGGVRFNAALSLADAERRQDALLYARAALRDFEVAGRGAAAQADQVRQLIAELEQEQE